MPVAMCVRLQGTLQHASQRSTVSCWRMPRSPFEHAQTRHRQNTCARVLLFFVLCTLVWQILPGFHDDETSSSPLSLGGCWGSSWPVPGMLVACGSGRHCHAPGGLNNWSIGRSTIGSSGSWGPLVGFLLQPAGAPWLATGAAAKLLRAVPFGHRASNSVPHQHQLQRSNGHAQALTSSTSSSSSVGVIRRKLQSASFLPLLGVALGLVSQLISPFAQICDDIQAPGARYACASNYVPQQPIEVEPPISRPATNRSDMQPRCGTGKTHLPRVLLICQVCTAAVVPALWPATAVHTAHLPMFLPACLPHDRHRYRYRRQGPM
jgi:hypothetical protein